MAELSSLLFVDTDELGRPTGLIASEENDTFASALMPQDVKDTVEVVKVADVSANYPGWNTVSGVSGLAPVSAELLALPSSFSDLEASVGYVSTVVDSIDPTAINGVSSTVLNFSGNWENTYNYVEDSSSTIGQTSSLVIGADSKLSSLEVSVGDISSVVDTLDPTAINDVSATVLNFSGNWENTYNYVEAASGDISSTSSLVIGSDSALSSLETSVGTISSVVATIDSDAINDVSTTVLNFSGTWNGASGVSAIDDVSNTVYTNSGTWNDASSVSGFNGVSAIVFDGSNVLSALSGTMPGASGGPDVYIYSALSTIADKIRFVDAITSFDKGGSGTALQLCGVQSIRTQPGKNLAISLLNVSSNETARIRIQSTPTPLAYLSAQVVGLVGANDIRIGTSSSDLTQGSSLKALYTKTQDSSASWDASYDYLDAASGNIEDVSAYVSDTSADVIAVSSLMQDGSGTLSVLSGISENPDYSATTETKADILAGLEGLLSVDVDTPTNVKYASSVGSVVFPGGVTFRAPQVGAAPPSFSVSAPGGVNLISVNGDIRYGTSSTQVSNLIDTIDALSAAIAAGGGGGGESDASAIKVGATSAVPIKFPDPPENNTILVLDTGNEQFTYERVAFQVIGDTIAPLTESLGFDFGGGTSRNFVTSGSTKTLLEFDDKSRVALGRAEIPLEISALSGADIDIGASSTVNVTGSSVVTFENDSNYGPLILIKGADVDASANTRMHFNNAELSANAETQIDIDTDITLGAAAHLDGNTLGAIHIACKNTQGTSVSGGTPVYITGNVGGSNKIEIGIASASVASSMPAVGILSEDLADNAEGYVDAFGIASLLDTSLFTSGDTLYVAPTGGLTNVRPTATTDLVQNIGIVELSDATNGKIIVLGPGRTNDVPNDVIRGFNRFEFTDFHSVNNNANSPFVGAAVNGGNTSLSIANYAWATTGAGWHVIRSGSSANSGYRWDTQAQRTGIATNQKFRAIFNTHNNNTDRMAWFGMKTAALDTTVTNGIYWELSGLSFTPVCKRSNASPTEVLGTTQTLSDDTTYIAEFSITDSSNVLFSLYSAPTENDLGSLIHSETVTISTTWSSAIPMRIGMAATHTGAVANQHMLAIDYMGFGFE